MEFEENDDRDKKKIQTKSRLGKILEEKSKLNMSISKRSRRIHNGANRSGNISIQRQTLRANNRALAQALQRYKHELNNANEIVLNLTKQKQALQLRANALSRVAELKNEDIEKEVQKRLEKKFGQLKEIFSMIGNLAAQGIDSYLGEVSSRQSLEINSTDQSSIDQDKFSQASPESLQAALQRSIYGNKARQEAKMNSMFQRSKPADLSLVVEKSVLDDIGPLPFEEDYSGLETVSELEELKRRSSSRPSKGRRSSLLDVDSMRNFCVAGPRISGDIASGSTLRTSDITIQDKEKPQEKDNKITMEEKDSTRKSGELNADDPSKIQTRNPILDPDERPLDTSIAAGRPVKSSFTFITFENEKPKSPGLGNPAVKKKKASIPKQRLPGLAKEKLKGRDVSKNVSPVDKSVVKDAKLDERKEAKADESEVSEKVNNEKQEEIPVSNTECVDQSEDLRVARRETFFVPKQKEPEVSNSESMQEENKPKNRRGTFAVKKTKTETKKSVKDRRGTFAVANEDEVSADVQVIPSAKIRRGTFAVGHQDENSAEDAPVIPSIQINDLDVSGNESLGILSTTILGEVDMEFTCAINSLIQGPTPKKDENEILREVGEEAVQPDAAPGVLVRTGDEDNVDMEDSEPMDGIFVQDENLAFNEESCTEEMVSKNGSIQKAVDSNSEKVNSDKSSKPVVQEKQQKHSIRTKEKAKKKDLDPTENRLGGVRSKRSKGKDGPVGLQNSSESDSSGKVDSCKSDSSSDESKKDKKFGVFHIKPGKIQFIAGRKDANGLFKIPEPKARSKTRSLARSKNRSKSKQKTTTIDLPASNPPSMFDFLGLTPEKPPTKSVFEMSLNESCPVVRETPNEYRVRNKHTSKDEQILTKNVSGSESNEEGRMEFSDHKGKKKDNKPVKIPKKTRLSKKKPTVISSSSDEELKNEAVNTTFEKKESINTTFEKSPSKDPKKKTTVNRTFEKSPSNEKESINTTFEKELINTTFEKESINTTFEKESNNTTFGKVSINTTFEKESNNTTFEKETINTTFEKESIDTTFEKESNNTTSEKEPINTTFEKESIDTTFEKESNNTTFEKESINTTFEKESVDTTFEKSPPNILNKKKETVKRSKRKKTVAFVHDDREDFPLDHSLMKDDSIGDISNFWDKKPPIPSIQEKEATSDFLTVKTNGRHSRASATKHERAERSSAKKLEHAERSKAKGKKRTAKADDTLDCLINELHSGDVTAPGDVNTVMLNAMIEELNDGCEDHIEEESRKSVSKSVKQTKRRTSQDLESPMVKRKKRRTTLRSPLTDIEVNSPTNRDEDSPKRARRSRTAVSYKEPSLTQKMRQGYKLDCIKYDDDSSEASNVKKKVNKKKKKAVK